MAISERQRIGLNAHLLNLSGNYRSAGINWYIFHLLQHLPAGEFDYTVFLSEKRADSVLTKQRLVQSRLPTNKPLIRVLWEQSVLPWMLRRERITLLHALAFAGPLAISIPWVVTVYDLSFVHFPELFNSANRLYLKWAVGYSARRAATLIAISESTKQDLVARFHVNPEKIAVIHCGLERSKRPTDAQDVEMLRQRYEIGEHFILHVGTIEPRKNIVRLLRAYARAHKQGRLPHRLVLVGARGWKYNDVDKTIEEEEITDSVTFVGYVPQEELAIWYRAADLFVYPSLYEGFGLPPLEAMANGTPVVTTNSSSLPEVVGDAALTVSPTDEQGLADAILRMLSERTLRDQMIERGLERAKCFSWPRAADATVDVYREVLSRGAHAQA